MIPLIWLSFAGAPRCCWDQDVIDDLCPYPIFGEVAQANGAVVIIPARYNVEHIPQINAFIQRLKWVVIFLTSDEESTFPWWKLYHRHMRIWVQSCRPDIHKNPSLRFFPVGCPEPDYIKTLPPERKQKTDVFYSGQVNHIQRDEMLDYFQNFGNSWVQASPGFTQGLDRRTYLASMAHAKIAPCPSGPASADSFRTWEALECGVVPIVDQGPKPDPEGRALTGYPRGFWEHLLKSKPFPTVENWLEADVARDIIEQFPVVNNQVFSWWQRKKREMRRRILKDVEEVMQAAGLQSDSILTTRGSSELTVLIPTSPTPNNPEFRHLFDTIKSIRTRTNAEIFVMFDGIRPELTHRSAAYNEYIRRVLWEMNHHWGDVYPFVYEEHLHQAEMTRRTLSHVETPLVMFVEHDTPLEGEIDFPYLIEFLQEDFVDVIRLYHEARMQPEHEHLMGGNIDPQLIQTIQWSQRPHLAQTSYYRRIINDYFSPSSRTMIEDRMHGVVQDEGWEFHRLALYAPKEGTMQRSTHLDARGDDPKFEMVF